MEGGRGLLLQQMVFSSGFRPSEQWLVKWNGVLLLWRYLT
jgi:hypothetical protein